MLESQLSKVICVVCKGKKPNTIAETIEGKKVHLHSTKCLAIFNVRKASKVKREPMIRGWVAKWAEDRYSVYHERPCACPKHRDEDEEVDVRFTEK